MLLDRCLRLLGCRLEAATPNEHQPVGFRLLRFDTLENTPWTPGRSVLATLGTDQSAGELCDSGRDLWSWMFLIEQ